MLAATAIKKIFDELAERPSSEPVSELEARVVLMALEQILKKGVSDYQRYPATVRFVDEEDQVSLAQLECYMLRNELRDVYLASWHALRVAPGEASIRTAVRKFYNGKGEPGTLDVSRFARQLALFPDIHLIDVEDAERDRDFVPASQESIERDRHAFLEMLLT